MIKIHQAIIMDDSVTFTITELCQACNVHAELISEMMAHGFIEPLNVAEKELQFPNYTLQRVKTAVHLQRDLDINMPGIALVLELLEELKELRLKIKNTG